MPDLNIERDANNVIVRATLAPCGAEWTPQHELSLKAWLHSKPCDDTPEDPEPPPEGHGDG